MTKLKTLLALAFLSAVAVPAAQAGGFDDSGSYNGYGAATQNTPSNFSLRDANGNLAIVNGQFVNPNSYSTTTGGQFASTSGGVGTSGAGAAYGQASAIGNQLNVVTVGNNNTVIVDSKQTNTGNQTASVALNGQ